MEREMEGSGVGLALCSSHGLSLSTGVHQTKNSCRHITTFCSNDYYVSEHAKKSQARERTCSQYKFEKPMHPPIHGSERRAVIHDTGSTGW